MNTPEPRRGFYTRKAFLAIIEKFKWPYESGMQDWPLEVSKHIDLGFCLQEYPKLLDDDEKFLLMEGILYALDQLQGEYFELYSYKTAAFLKADFDIHKSTIFYWTLYDDEIEAEDGFAITPLMREIWDARLK
jgi:hypothetical protein